MKKEEKKDIKENIKWFKKFSLEKRFKIAEIGRKSIKILRTLTIQRHAKSKRAT